MLIPAIGSVNSFNQKANIASVKPTRNVSNPSFGYGVEGHEYEHAAMKALEKYVKNIEKSPNPTSFEEGVLAFKQDISERMMNCFDGANPKEDSDQLMNILVGAAEKLGLISKESYKVANSKLPLSEAKALDFVV